MTQDHTRSLKIKHSKHLILHMKIHFQFTITKILQKYKMTNQIIKYGVIKINMLCILILIFLFLAYLHNINIYQKDKIKHPTMQFLTFIIFRILWILINKRHKSNIKLDFKHVILPVNKINYKTKWKNTCFYNVHVKASIKATYPI